MVATSSRVTVCGALAVALLVSGCAVAGRVERMAADHAHERSFYVVPDPLRAAAPGTLIRSKVLRGAPDRTTAWRVRYHSRDVTGRDIAVSGVVVAPARRAPAGGWPVVAWAHPTTGAARKCAPSTNIDPFDLIEGLTDLTGHGYVMAATDYSGMGASGPSSYLIGSTEGNNVLDSARAARQIAQAHAGTRLLLWGHSQGGQAILFAAHAAPAYAPELHLLGAAVTAPAAELGSLLRDDVVDDSGVTLGAYAFDAYQKVYGPTAPGTSLTSILTPAVAAATPRMAALCLIGQHKPLHTIAKPLVGHYLTADPAQVKPWRTWLAENTPPTSGFEVPLFIAQGATDHLVHPATTTQYVDGLCAAGQRVRYLTIPKTGHGLVALRALPTVIRWFDDLLAGRSVESTCTSPG